MLYLVFALVAALASARAPGDHGVMDGQWIVVFHNNVTAAMRASHMERLNSANGGEVGSEWNIGGHFKAYGLKTSDALALKMLRADPMVDYVDADPIIKLIEPIVHETNSTLTHPDPESWGRSLLQTCQTVTTQSWGISKVSRSSSGNYLRESTSGSGVTTYVLDTGSRASHSNFGGRDTCARSFIPNQQCADGHGHGTHCACTVIGSNVGVAQASRSISLKVLSNAGSSSGSSVIDGINHAVSDCSGNCVISMSLGGGFNSALNSAVNSAFRSGLVVVVAAGNDNANACNYSPASAADAISVGSTSSNDARSSFSNFGNCVDVFAPGSSILSCGISSDTAGATMSGTSMACPHVAGLAARYWANGGSRSPANVKSFLISAASQPPAVSNPGSGSPTRLAYLNCPN